LSLSELGKLLGAIRCSSVYYLASC
jgi:hypothetical protein